MKFAIIVDTFFFFAFSALGGTFSETFTEGNLADWRELNAHDAVLSSWEISDGELEGINHGGGAHFLITGNQIWQDYNIQVDVKPLKKHGPGNIMIAARVGGSWAVSCEITDLILNDPESKVVCTSEDVHSNTGEVLYIGPHPLLRENKWARLKLSVNKDQFIFWINKKKIVETGDPFILQGIKLKTRDLSRHPVDGGGAGFGLGNYTARFDNITITGESIPDRGGLPVSPRAKLATTWGELKQF